MKSIILSILIISSGILYAQEFTRFDQNPEGVALSREFAEMNGELFISSACDPEGCDGIWSTSGNPDDLTQLAHLFNSGMGLATEFQMIAHNNLLYFQARTADDIDYGVELWVSDGTAEGTMMLKDIREGSGSSNPKYFTPFGDIVLFVARSNDHGEELWRTDGTPEGTYLLKDIYEGTQHSDPRQLTEMNGTVYFQAETFEAGEELWKSDGTEAGTVMVKDIRPGTDGSMILNMTVYNDMLIFRAWWGTLGVELFKSDGTAEGTVPVKNINPAPFESSTPDHFYEFNGLLYFAASDGPEHGHELWVTDGSEEGTYLVKDIHPGYLGSQIADFAELDGTLYFTAYDQSDVFDKELWKTDGTPDGTILAVNISPDYSSDPEKTMVYNNKLYFIAKANGTDYQLIESDGTPAGTNVIAPEGSTFSNSFLGNETFYEYNNALYFTAQFDTVGRALWKYSDGSTGLNNEAENASFKLYPNPGNGLINLRGEFPLENHTLHISNIKGQKITSLKTAGNTVDLQKFPPGVYIIQVEGTQEILKYVKIN